MPRKKIIFSKYLQIELLHFDNTQQEKLIKFWKRIDPKLWDAPHKSVWESQSNFVHCLASNIYTPTRDAVHTLVTILNLTADPDAEWYESRLVRFECFYWDSFDNCEARRLRGKRTKVANDD